MFKGQAGVLWRSVRAVYELDPAEEQLLRQACHTLVELERIDAELSERPVMLTGSMGQPVSNPLLATAQAHRKLLESLLRSLALPVSGESVGVVRYPQQRRAAKLKGVSGG